MKAWPRILIFTLLVLVVASCNPCEPPESAHLTVTLRPQETSMWCWAASAQMIMEFLGTNIAQCTQANNRFGLTICCNSPTPATCIKGGWPEFEKYGFSSLHTSDAALSWGSVKNEIGCRETPFAFTWHWNSGGGHVMVITGYQTVDGINFVSVNNPGPANVGSTYEQTYTDYVSGATYTHWDDYYNVRATGE